MHFSIMNKTPFHFIAEGALLIIFLWATFLASDTQKSKGLIAMHFLFALVLMAGIYIWTLVPFSFPLLIKSAGGIGLYGIMIQIVKNPKSGLY
jgi:hypothetical protein